MSNLTIAMPSFDADGFMWELDYWDEATARQIASMDGLGVLDERQITLLRHLWARRGSVSATWWSRKSSTACS
jgi:sulfur relay (sulfurtransferase) DsrC/TusE family protein